MARLLIIFADVLNIHSQDAWAAKCAQNLAHDKHNLFLKGQTICNLKISALSQVVRLITKSSTNQHINNPSVGDNKEVIMPRDSCLD